MSIYVKAVQNKKHIVLLFHTILAPSKQKLKKMLILLFNTKSNHVNKYLLNQFWCSALREYVYLMMEVTSACQMSPNF